MLKNLQTILKNNIYYENGKLDPVTREIGIGKWRKLNKVEQGKKNYWIKNNQEHLINNLKIKINYINELNKRK